MASHKQTYQAGQAEGRARERGEQMKDNIKDKAEAAKQKTFEAAQQAKDKTFQTSQAAKDKTQESGHATGEKAGEAREKSAGILQQTGEKMRNMATGAADAVKHTFGMADQAEDEDVDHFTNRRPGH
ncbi:hypothetical protein CCACVL1_27926 [Corchorus capsularis]|uniref:Uncharacterized protein n=1 Tax=Corchorus capsularis TaxID=210143 RepID=A0A1R3G855_COCAP|nr:hypothetical protein CCACVL1_27926 [Corchorus capsularis]